jgi:hypothetical protein
LTIGCAVQAMSHTSDEQEINSIALTLVNEAISSMEKSIIDSNTIKVKKRNLMYLKIFLFFRERQIHEKMELLQNDLKQCKDKNKLEQVLSIINE